MLTLVLQPCAHGFAWSVIPVHPICLLLRLTKHPLLMNTLDTILKRSLLPIAKASDEGSKSPCKTREQKTTVNIV